MKKILLFACGLFFCLNLAAQGNLEKGLQYYNWREYKTALPYLQSAAKEGYGEACYLLGEMYYYGLGTEKNPTIAMRMYQRGIEYGHGRGEVELGDIYLYVSKDHKKAFEAYQRAYQRKEPEAGCRMALFYYYNNLIEAIGESFNLTKAFDFIQAHFDEAAKSRDVNVLCLTSAYCRYLYDTGQQKIDSYKKADEVACELLYKANQHYQTVCLMRKYNLAVVPCRYLDYNKFFVYSVVTESSNYLYTDLQRGEMFYIYAMFAHEYNDIDYKMNWGYTAAEAMEKAANYGYVPAQKTIGEWYANGTHTAKNLVKAREWYAKAKANGEEVPE